MQNLGNMSLWVCYMVKQCCTSLCMAELVADPYFGQLYQFLYNSEDGFLID